jgi:hypothetical protein
MTIDDPGFRAAKRFEASNNVVRMPAPKDNGDDPSLIARELLQMAGMISAADLDTKVFPPLRWHVPGLVPEGLGLLVAPPKAGKSWMVAAVGLACAAGGKAFGCIDVDSRPVLYMALEDGQRRLQDRHRMLLLGHDEKKPDNLHLIFSATPMTAPGIVAAFLLLYGDACPLVIVDTLVKIRPRRHAADDPYQFDYQFASQLKGLLDPYPGAGLLAVHHARKAVAEDFVAEASGTHGLVGAADYIMVLRHPRLSTQGSLLVTGRDVPEGEYAVVTDQGRGWRLDGETLGTSAAHAETRQQQGKLGDRSAEVLAFVKSRGENPTSAAEVAAATGIDVKQCSTYLGRLKGKELLDRAGRGLYIDPVCCVGSVGNDDQDNRETNTSNTTNTTPYIGDAGFCACGEQLTSPASIRYGACQECRTIAGNDDEPPKDETTDD